MFQERKILIHNIYNIVYRGFILLFILHSLVCVMVGMGYVCSEYSCSVSTGVGSWLSLNKETVPPINPST